MNKRIQIVFLAALFACILGSPSMASLQAQAMELCCIAGQYGGFQVNYAKPNCPGPLKEHFTMVVKQMRPCSAKITGTVTDASGTVSNWTGILTRAPRGCCTLEGSFLTPSGNTVKFKGVICLKLGKWHAQGAWEEIGSTDPCRGSGTWQMTQV